MVTVYFSCKQCGLKKVPVQVPARIDPEPEAVIPWMNQVARCCSEEHDRHSPGCKITELTELMIPTEGAEFIGQQVE